MPSRAVKSNSSSTHAISRSALSTLLEMGVPAHVVQEIAGHSDISITLGIYGQPGQQAKVVDR